MDEILKKHQKIVDDHVQIREQEKKGEQKYKDASCKELVKIMKWEMTKPKTQATVLARLTIARYDRFYTQCTEFAALLSLYKDTVVNIDVENNVNYVNVMHADISNDNSKFVYKLSYDEPYPPY
jgi:hypothetical protein